MNRSVISPRKLLMPAAVYFVIVATKLWAETSPTGAWLMISATALIATADLLAEAHVSVAVFLYSSALQMVVAVVAAAIALSLLFAHLGVSLLETLPGPALTRLVVGALVGIAVRNRFLASCERRRAGEDTYNVRLHLALAAGLLVFLFPADGLESGAASWYVLGFGVGFLVHFTLRRADQRAQRRLELARRIYSTLAELASMPLNTVEVKAIQFFAKQQWRRLVRLFQTHEGKLTMGLRLIKATLERVQGDNLEAVRTLRDELQRPERVNTPHDHLAWMLLAVCHRDLGERGAMWMYLARSEEIRPNCVLRLLIKGLCLTEELPLPGERAWAPNADGISEAGQCLDQACVLLQDARSESALATVISCGVPLTRRFVNDTYAYFLLKKGVLSPSRTLLEACLREDSRSASSHLHLGEWYRVNAALAEADRDIERAEQHRRAADFCLRMAVSLSRHRDSHTRRRAQELLENAVLRRPSRAVV